MSWKSTFLYTEMKYCDGKCWIFRDQSSRRSWSYGLVVGGPVRSWGLDLVILQVLCGWRCSVIPGLYSSAPALPRGQVHFRGHRCHQHCGELRGWQEGLGNTGRGDTDREEQLCQSQAAPNSQGSSGSTATGQPKDIRPTHALFRRHRRHRRCTDI